MTLSKMVSDAESVVQRARADLRDAEAKVRAAGAFLSLVESTDFGPLRERVAAMLTAAEGAALKLGEEASLGRLQRALGKADGIRQIAQSLDVHLAYRAAEEAAAQAETLRKKVETEEARVARLTGVDR